ncbi:MAG: dipeptidase [Devosiaceae bacterium]|nr:dipeptidase [Devosiaceae bacterium]
MVSRRLVIGGGAAVLAVGGAALAYPLYLQLFPPIADTGFSLSEEELARAVAFLAQNPAIDSHAHPGRTFVEGAENLAWKLRVFQSIGTFEERVIDEMKTGGLAAASFSAVSDFPVLDTTGGGLASTRDFGHGEAWAYYQAQMKNLKSLVEQDLVYPVLTPEDVELARAAGKPGAIFAVEGADFIESNLARIQTAWDDGVRILTFVHFVKGGVMGDVMTAEAVHGGMSAVGRDAFTEMQRVGIMVDLSHSAEKTAFDALELSTKPVVGTHTHILSPELEHPRFISIELAQGIVESGGFVAAWPAGIGMSTLNDYLERIEQMVDMLGADGVALGTDMDSNYKPVWSTYLHLPLVVGGLLKRGMEEEVIAKIIGGNFMRVFSAVQA